MHLDRDKNVWFDFGADMGGTNVQLIMLARHCSKRDAYQFLEEMDPASVREQPLSQAKQRDAYKGMSPAMKVGEIKCYYITRYLSERGIPLDLARKYCKEITVYSPEKDMNFTYIGFQNNVGGYAMRSPGGFKRTDKASATVINTEGKLSTKPTTKNVAIFEGFFDFLSWQVMQRSLTPTCDIVVLNSVNNLKAAANYITAHDKAICFLDNDQAGEKCASVIGELMKGQGKEAVDMSDIYGEYKDINEMLQASLDRTQRVQQQSFGVDISS